MQKCTRGIVHLKLKTKAEKYRYRERRKAIKNHWAQKSSKLKTRPKEF